MANQIVIETDTSNVGQIMKNQCDNHNVTPVTFSVAPVPPPGGDPNAYSVTLTYEVKNPSLSSKG